MIEGCKLICFLLVGLSLEVYSQVPSSTATYPFNKTERIRKFLASFTNPAELEYIRQGLQTLRNQQQSFALVNHVSQDDLQYVQNLKFLHQQLDPKNASHEFKSIEEMNKGLEDYLYEGDILLSRQQIDEMTNLRKKRQALTLDYRWDKTKPIYYRFDPNLDSAVPPLFRVGAKFWSDNTCLNLVETKSTSSIRVFDGTGTSTGCFAGSGRFTTDISISASSGCNYFGIITHEIAHALGIMHEQIRYDRDDFITPIPSNMNAFYLKYFLNQKLSYSNSNNFGLPYDWGSNMHYRPVNDENQTIALAKDRLYQSSMGRAMAPSFKDIYLMNVFYNCLCTSGAACQNGGFRHPRNCNICICPSGLGGAVCNERPKAENGAADIGAVLSAGANYQTLSGKIGDPQRVLQRAQAVHWHIYAPQGKSIEITILSVSGYCYYGCGYGSLDVKVKNFLIEGVRYCCPSDVAANPVLISQGSFASVSLYSQAYGQGFSLKYRYINPPPTTTTTTTTRKPCVDIATNCVTNVALCSNNLYLDIMKEKCPKTCGYCNGGNPNCSDGATNCITNAALCYNNLYQQLMKEKCYKTCRYC